MTDGRYAYDATIRLRIRANGIDEAHRIARAAVVAVARINLDGVESAHASMLDLHHRPDVDGSLRT